MKGVITYSICVPLVILFAFTRSAAYAVENKIPLNEDREDLIFAFAAYAGEWEIEALILAGSIRRFGGEWADNPIWVLVAERVDRLTEATRARLADLGVRLIPYEVEAQAQRFPFAAKVFASAVAEAEAEGKTDLLAWIDCDTIVIREPKDWLLPQGKSLGYRPVQHKLIGPAWDQPPDAFWELVYRECNATEERMFPMTTPVDRAQIRPYFNAGMLIVRPEKGILRTWKDNFRRLYRHPAFTPFYEKDVRYLIFVHQAILSGTVLSILSKDEMLEVSELYNYPLNLHDQFTGRGRVERLNDLVTCRYDEYERLTVNQKWRAAIQIDDPLRSWLDDQLKIKGINVLALLSQKYGANYYLNRDQFELYGWNVILTGVSDSIQPCDFYAESLGVQPLKPDLLFTDLEYLGNYHALAVMPSSAYFQPDPFRDVLDNGQALELVKKAAGEGLAVSTICSGSRVLAAADIIRDKKIIGQPSFKAEYEAAGAILLDKDHPPAIEGNIITGARDQYYNFANCQAIATVIESRQGRGDHTNPVEGEFIFSADAAFGEGEAQWVKTYGGAGSDGARAMVESADGGFLLVGYTFSHGSGDADALAVRTDSEGNIVWSKSFGGAGTEYGNGCAAVGDGYLIVGYTSSYGAGSKDVYVIKVDTQGNEVWSRTFGGRGWDVGTCVCEASDGGYIVCGYTNSSGAGEEDVYLIKLDGDGNEVWLKTFGGERSEIGNSVYPLDDGGYIVGGTTGSFGGGNCDFYLVRTDAEGNEVWSRSYGEKLESELDEAGRTPFDWCASMRPAGDGGYVLVGYSNCRDIMNVLAFKTDAEGNQQWGKVFGKGSFYDYGQGVAAAADGGFVVCGTTKSIDGKNDIYLVRLSASGDIVWEKTVGGAGSEWGGAVCITKKDEVFIAGQTRSAGNGSFDSLLLKLN